MRRRSIGLACVAGASVSVVVPAAFTTSAASADPPLVSVYPSPNTHFASPGTQLSFRGVTAAQLGTVYVTGSRTGVHSFTLKGHPDGKGVSLLPDRPFRRRETVSVGTRLNVRSARDGDFRIDTAATGNPIKRARVRELPDRASQLQVIHSRPDLRPSRIGVDKTSRGVTPGSVFVAPKIGPGHNGPMIFDNRGDMTWFDRLPPGQEADGFRPQRLGKKPVLTWWQGFLNYGTGNGYGKIVDQHYRPVAEVKAGNGFGGLDPHELKLTSRGTAIVTIQTLVYRDLSSIGGTKQAQVFDAIVQEIDVASGLVLFEWHSLDHVGIGESHTRPPKVKNHTYDYFHINSIEPYGDAKMLISARNTWGVYKIDKYTGKVDWRLGGKRSSFKLGKGAGFAWQHDARVQRSGLITLFDNGAFPPVHKISRGIGLRVRGKNARLVKEYRHSKKLLSGSQGNMQRLPNGNVFIGWGANPVFSEYSPHGRELFSAHLATGTNSYRAYRGRWSGRPDRKPAVVASTDGRTTKVYASWNGATGVASWDVLAGERPDALARVGAVKRDGFETLARIKGAHRYVAVRAKGSDGKLLAVSAVLQPRRAEG